MLNEYQKIADGFLDGALTRYEEGEEGGDTLALFLLRELAFSEDCNSRDEARNRVDTAARELSNISLELLDLPEDEVVENQRIQVRYSPGFADCYSVLFLDERADLPVGGVPQPAYREGLVYEISMSPDPENPRGVLQHGDADPDIKGDMKIIPYRSLPDKCKKVVDEHLKDLNIGLEDDD